MQMRQNNDEMMSYINDLNSWEAEIKQKEKVLKAKADQASLVWFQSVSHKQMNLANHVAWFIKVDNLYSLVDAGIMKRFIIMIKKYRND